MRIVGAAAAALMLMACTTVPPEANATLEEPGVPVQGGGVCNAGAVQDMVGRQRSDTVGADAMRRSGASALRWIVPDSAYTMDYREDRLNIEVDARGRITRLRCG